METLLPGYQLCAASEGKSKNATAIVSDSVRYFRDFLVSEGQALDVTRVSQHELRAYILYLQQKRCFASHRFNCPLEKGLSGHTINCYLRSLRIFFSWLVSEEVIDENPFDRVKIPRPPRKVIRVFSDAQHRVVAWEAGRIPWVSDLSVTMTAEMRPLLSVSQARPEAMGAICLRMPGCRRNGRKEEGAPGSVPYVVRGCQVGHSGLRSSSA